MTENKKIVRSSVSALVQMSDEDLENQIKKELEEIKLKKQKAVQIKKQRQKVFENQNRKKRTHALILFATDYIKTEQMLSVAYLEKMIETVTRETDKEDLKLLLDTL